MIAPTTILFAVVCLSLRSINTCRCSFRITGGIGAAAQRTLFIVLMLLAVASSFHIAPNVMRDLRSDTKYTSRSVTRSPMTQSTSLELADGTSRLPDIARAVFENDKRPVLLYDGVCNMCNGFVNLFLDVDKEEKFRFSALQSQTGRALLSLSGRSPDDISRYYNCSTAVLI